MKKLTIVLIALLLVIFKTNAQQNLTPELLWKLNRVSGIGISKDKKYVVYNVSTPNVEENKSSSKKYFVSIEDGKVLSISNIDSLVADATISPDTR